MPPDVRVQFVHGTNVEAAMQWLRENSEPCPHGASFEELRELIRLPVRRKLPKHVRAYLEEAICQGVVTVMITDEGVRYGAREPAPPTS